MPDSFLIDSDVLIDYLRGDPATVEFLESMDRSAYMSVITLAELFAGVREGGERTALESFIAAFELVQIDAEIAVRGGLYRRDYGKSHGVGLSDALIAATAEARQARLVTLNAKHFPMLDGVITPYQKS